MVWVQVSRCSGWSLQAARAAERGARQEPVTPRCAPHEAARAGHGRCRVAVAAARGALILPNKGDGRLRDRGVAGSDVDNPAAAQDCLL